jgi:hypothetical protein
MSPVSGAMNAYIGKALTGANATAVASVRASTMERNIFLDLGSTKKTKRRFFWRIRSFFLALPPPLRGELSQITIN